MVSKRGVRVGSVSRNSLKKGKAVTKGESRAYFSALGRCVAALRKQQGMTQAELARSLGVSQQTVFAYELGERRISVLTLGKLADVFGTPVEVMMGRKKPARIVKQRLSPQTVRQADRLQRLPKTQQRFIVKIIDSLDPNAE